MTKQKKLLAGFMTLVILVVLLFSIFFITAETHHTCIGENCPICLEIQACVQALNSFGTGLFMVIAIVMAAYILIICVTFKFHFPSLRTLVSLKVKLTN